MVPSYVLKRLHKPWWRGWLQRNEQKVKTTLKTRKEHQEYAGLIVQHASPTANPQLADDDIMAITIAHCRNLPLAMRDKNAERVARGLGVKVVTLEELLELLGSPQLPLL